MYYLTTSKSHSHLVNVHLAFNGLYHIFKGLLIFVAQLCYNTIHYHTGKYLLVRYDGMEQSIWNKITLT